MKKMIKLRLIFFVIVLNFCFQSCEDSNDELNNDITVSIADFTVSIDENPIADLSLGTVQATTNEGNISFSILEQIPNQAIQINETTGEITVLTESLFDYETNPTITGVVRAENSGISQTANITINLNDVIEVVDDYKLIAVSDFGQVFEIGNNTGNIGKYWSNH